MRPAAAVQEAAARRRTVVVIAAAAGLVAAVLVVAAMAAGRGSTPTGSGPVDPAGSDPGLAHVHGLGVDPSDDSVYAASHHGVFRIGADGTAVRVADRYQDTMGFLVVGPRHFLASGHPDLREDLPGRLGLIESTDAADSWRPVSLLGEADFHGLRLSGQTLYGYEAGGRLMVTEDRMRWQTVAAVELLDFAVAPTQPRLLVATTAQGVAVSSDGGRSFQSIAGAPVLAAYAWPSPRALYGADRGGRLHLSADSGRTWRPLGRVDGPVEALTATADGRVYAATDTGIWRSTDRGARFGLLYRTDAK